MHLCDHEGLDLAGVRDMGTNTEVDHGTTSVDSGGGTIGNFGLDDLPLVFVVLIRSSQTPQNQDDQNDHAR